MIHEGARDISKVIEQCSDALLGDEIKATYAHLDQQQIQAEMTSTPKTILVFEGGGAKGLVYAGALKVLQQADQVKNVDKVAGSSAGGIAALLVATGHSAEQIEDIMSNLDLKQELQDSSRTAQVVNATVNAVNATSKYAVPAYGLTRYVTGGEIPLEICDAGITGVSAARACLWGEYDGAWQGERFIAIARDLLQKRLGRTHCTFAELHAMRDEFPELKDLYLTGTKIDPDTKELSRVVFSHENELTKDVDIIDALRATASFPFAFKPHTIQLDGQPYQFIDGGVLNNYPMDIFDLTDSEGRRIPNPAVLGFKVDDAGECEEILFSDKRRNKVKRIGKFQHDSHDGDVRHFYRYNTVQIYDADVWTLNFDLDKLTKLILMLSGEKATQQYMELGYLDRPTHEDPIIRGLITLGQSLNDADYATAQGVLYRLKQDDPVLAKKVAKIVLEIIGEFTISGLKPGVTYQYEQLIHCAAMIAEVEPQDYRVLKVAGSTACGGALVGGGLLCVGALNPVTAPFIAVGAGIGLGSSLLFQYGSKKESQVPTLKDGKQAFNEYVLTQINGKYYQEALLAIDHACANLSQEDLSTYLKALRSLVTKGMHNDTRAKYDSLEQYLTSMIDFKLASAEALEIQASASGIKVTC